MSLPCATSTGVDDVADLNNVQRSTSLRTLVALTLRSLGIEAAEPRPRPRSGRLSERIAEDWAGDVLGVDGFLISTRADLRTRYGPALDAARQAAIVGGHGRGVVVQYRDHVHPEDYIVTMTLGDFAGLVRELQGART